MINSLPAISSHVFVDAAVVSAAAFVAVAVVAAIYWDWGFAAVVAYYAAS